MKSRPTPAEVPVEKSPKDSSRLERAALAHKNAVEERWRIEQEVGALQKKLGDAEHTLREAQSTANQTAKQLTDAALGKPE